MRPVPFFAHCYCFPTLDPHHLHYLNNNIFLFQIIRKTLLFLKGGHCNDSEQWQWQGSCARGGVGWHIQVCCLKQKFTNVRSKGLLSSLLDCEQGKALWKRRISQKWKITNSSQGFSNIPPSAVTAKILYGKQSNNIKSRNMNPLKLFIFEDC